MKEKKNVKPQFMYVIGCDPIKKKMFILSLYNVFAVLKLNVEVFLSNPEKLEFA